MDLSFFKNGGKLAINFAEKHLPEILTGVSSVGVVVTAILSAKATTKASELIKEANAEKPSEKIKASWKCYIPTAVSAVLTIASVVGGTKVSLTREAALLGLYSMSQKTLSEDEAKIKELFGEKKKAYVKEEVMKEKMARSFPTEEELKFIPGVGNVLCYESTFGHYFWGSMDKINMVESDAKLEVKDNMYISVNDIYSMLGVPDIDIGDELGWDNPDNIVFTRSTMIAPNEKPCIVMTMAVSPKFKYDWT